MRKRLCSSRKDRISALPDSLIQHILSFLELKQVIASSVISSRWRLLWTSVPTLDLGSWDLHKEEYSNIPTSITRSLLRYDCPKITEFNARFNYQLLDHQNTDAWISFAVKREVKALNLNIFYEKDMDDFYHEKCKKKAYKVLGCLLKCSYLEVLKLSFCKLNLNVSSSSLCMLKKLELSNMWLSDLDTSGCPVLESLIIFQCNQLQPLNIYAPNPKLRFLKINEFYSIESVKLDAPKLQSIQFDVDIRRAYNIKNMSSLQSASFQLKERSTEESKPQLLELLQDICHASTLKLNQGFMKIWNLSRTPEVKLPIFRAISLQLKIKLNNTGFLGMVSVLRGVDYLESLSLEIEYFSEKDHNALSQESWSHLGHSLSTKSSLKIVEIKNFLSKDPASTLYSDDFLNNWEMEVKLVMTLLNTCTMLEEMRVSTTKYSTFPLKSQLLLDLSKSYLMASQRASQKAELHFI